TRCGRFHRPSDSVITKAFSSTVLAAGISPPAAHQFAVGQEMAAISAPASGSALVGGNQRRSEGPQTPLVSVATMGGWISNGATPFRRWYQPPTVQLPALGHDTP